LYYKENGSGGASHTFSYTVSGSHTNTIYAGEITGGLTSGILDQQNAQTDSASPFTSPSITTTQANEILVSILSAHSTINPATVAESTGFTLQAKWEDGTASWPGCIASKVVSSTGAYNSSFTCASADDAGIHIASFKALATGLTYDTDSGASADSCASTLSWSHTVTDVPDTALFVGAGVVGLLNAINVTGVTFNGIPMTNIWNILSDSPSPDFQIRNTGWILTPAPAGTYTVIVSYSGTGQEVAGTSASFNGCDRTVPTGIVATAMTNGTPSGTATVNAIASAGDIVIDFVMTSQQTITVGAGQTSRSEQENINLKSSGGMSTEPGPGTITMSWTLGTGGYANEWAIGAVAIKPVGAFLASPYGLNARVVRSLNG
jgi:hypothetical protein